MAELGTTADPKELVPGDAPMIYREVALCFRYAENLERAGDGLKQLDTGDWSGEAAEAFHDAFDGHPVQWIKASEAFQQAAEVLHRYAEMLEWAQGQAGEAIAVWGEGETAAAQGNEELATEKHTAAQDMLHRARMQLVEAGDRAAKALNGISQDAPDQPGFWGQVGTQLSQFGQGIGDWVGDLGDIVSNLDNIPAAVSQAWAHPMEFAKGLISWDQWHTNPMRAFGHVLPDALLSLVGGAGAIKKGASLLKKVPNKIDGCFVAGTLVLTESGHRAIEELARGDRVWSVCPDTGEQGWYPITTCIVREVPSLLDLMMDKGELLCSPEHPFWVDGSGWTKAGDLKPGDLLRDLKDAKHEIKAIRGHSGTFTVYNIEVEGLHTYHVSNLSLLVHNKAMGAPEPDGVPKKRDVKWLKRQGIDPHEVKEILPEPASRSDLYVDKRGNIFAARKGEDPKSGEFIGNILDYGE